MTSPVLTARTDEPLDTVVTWMLEAGVGRLTRKDVLRTEMRRARLTWGSVAQQMNHDVSTVAPDASAAGAARLLRETGRHVLPVLEGEQLVGVIHARDLETEVEREEAAHGSLSPDDPRFLEGQAVRDLMPPQRAPAGE